MEDDELTKLVKDKYQEGALAVDCVTKHNVPLCESPKLIAGRRSRASISAGSSKEKPGGRDSVVGTPGIRASTPDDKIVRRASRLEGTAAGGSKETNSMGVPTIERPLTIEEKTKNFERAMDYFQKTKEINESTVRVRASICGRQSIRGSLTASSSAPNLRATVSLPDGLASPARPGSGAGVRKISKNKATRDEEDRKESKGKATKGSKDGTKGSRGEGEPKAAAPAAEETPLPPKAMTTAQLLLAMQPKRQSLLVSAAKSLMEAKDVEAGKEENAGPVQSSQIGGSIIMGKNTLLERLKARAGEARENVARRATVM